MWGRRGADVNPYILRRAAPAWAISGGARRDVCSVSYTAQCPRGTRPHAAVARSAYPGASAIPNVAVGVRSPQDCGFTWLDGRGCGAPAADGQERAGLCPASTHASVSDDSGGRGSGGGLSQIVALNAVLGLTTGVTPILRRRICQC